jgi:Fe-S cluster assembly scaffold protein SufB
MAVKAIGKIRLDELIFENDAFQVRLDIAAEDNVYVSLVEAGTYPATDSAAVTNAALAAFVKAYAETELNIVFGVGDVALLVNGFVFSLAAV